MRASCLISPLAAGTLLGASTAVAQSWKTIPTIEAYGQHFFYSNNGSQFYMKGVAYQQNYQPNGAVSANTKYTDPLADADQCRRDIPVMKEIFTNVIRVYALDPTVDHDDCMQQLADADIYVVADLSEPATSINSNDPDWNVPLYIRYTSVIDTMSKYSNVIGFFAGNEVVSAANQTASAAFVKAAVRDSKSYIADQGYRSSLGVGYATADVPSRDDLAAYFACGNETTSIDFWGYNVYSWCGNSSFTASSYDERVQFFSDYPVPVFFAEYGCNQNIDGGPYERPFTEVPVLYGPEMDYVFSGGIVYQYFDDENEYGLVSIVNSASVSPYPDYTSLSMHLATVSPSITMSSAYTPNATTPACPTVGPSGASLTWAAEATPLPPPVNPQFCACEVESFGCAISSNDASSYGDVFDYICSSNAAFCDGFEHNATTGSYGALAMCNAQQQLGWAANQYYNHNGKSSSACDFSGIAKVQRPSTSAGCASLLSQAGAQATGVVAGATGQQGTNAPGATGGSGGSGGGSGSGSSSSSSGAGVPGLGVPPSFFDFGGLYLALYTAVAVVSGFGIFVL